MNEYCNFVLLLFLAHRFTSWSLQLFCCCFIEVSRLLFCFALVCLFVFLLNLDQTKLWKQFWPFGMVLQETIG